MEALVTGGCGFVGRFLTQELSREFDRVEVIDYHVEPGLFQDLDNVHVKELDVRDLDEQEDLVRGIDTVFHLAGLLGTTELYTRIIEAEEINVIGTLKLLEAMRKHDVIDIIYMSKPQLWENSVYTITKKQSERYVNAYQEVYGFRPKIVRPFNIYGPEERVDIYRKAIPYFIISALRNEPLEIFGSGEQTMDLIYVLDVANALIEIQQDNDAVGEVIEIGTGDPIEVNQVAQKIIRLADSESIITHLPMRAGEKEDTLVRADTSKMNELLNFEPKWDLEAGLNETISYYRDNLDRYTDIYEFDERLIGKSQ